MMDIEQLEKRVEWLDDERRKDKGTIADLQKKIAKLEGMLDKTNEHIKEMSGEVTHLSVVVAKVDDFDESLATHRTAVKKELDTVDKRVRKREEDFRKQQELEVDKLNTRIAEVRKEVEVVGKLRDEIRGVGDIEGRTNRMIQEMQEKLNNFADGEAERSQAIRSIEDDRRQDNKRLTDLQGEVTAVRKRTDEQRGKIELATESHKKVDVRINELISAEGERRERMNEFIEKVSQGQADRERTWNEWNDRVDRFEGQAEKLQDYLTNIGETERAVRKAQADFEDITEQISRRIKEITEMQRLSEERFRQEWSTFKADDQKRWTNYTLTQEEQHREMNRQVERLGEQGTDLEDNLQELQDVVQYLSEQAEKRLTAALAVVRDWVAENERFLSSSR